MRFARLLADRSGVTAVEFAIILPAMLTLICGATEIGHMMFARLVLESAVVDAARIATASIDSSEAARNTVMRASIARAMSSFPLAPGGRITIRTRVYRDFSTAFPEPFDDANGNGVYNAGETYIDRNKNGRRDDAVQIGGTMGGPGDVVSITAIYPKRVLFGFLNTEWALGSLVNMSATTVVRNEAVRRTVS